ncbi:unnamed protein product [Medioppia subpectinata]|uniref:Uncharacterized protein n=1 Tax=Medioppia subpectinata TaxID=1979941 RepID=A0A7R9KNZ9_9ACAR|nr:unnamed protein product [Medioppia subpectinata]CAG2106757.1 unnamed protein product [Medioppia subpectinata]
MKWYQLGIPFVAVFGLALAGAPYEWNSFIKEVETSVNEVSHGKAMLETDIGLHPERRDQHKELCNQLIDQIIDVQDKLDDEYQYRDQLTEAQKTTLTNYINLTDKTHKQLSDILKNI